MNDVKHIEGIYCSSVKNHLEESEFNVYNIGILRKLIMVIEGGDGEKMREFRYTINDRMGIHARPAGFFVEKAASFPCKVTVEKGGKEVNAKKIFGVMGLAVKCGQAIILRTDGDQEEEAMMSLRKFLEDNL